MENKKIETEAASEGLATIISFFLKPAVFLWMMPTIAAIIPAVAPLCALGYWQWMGLTLIIGWLCRWAGTIIHK